MSTTASRKKIVPSLPESYLRLIREFPLRPIHSRAQYDTAAAVLDRLVIRDEKNLDAGERDYLEMLELAIGAYDDEHAKALDRDNSSPLDRLKSLLGDHKLNTEGLGKIVGSQPLASLILTGRRPMSRKVIYKLAERFKVEPGYFL